MQKNIFITGCSSGLGLALSALCLKKGYKVYGIARNKPALQDKNFIYKYCDLSKIEYIKEELSFFIKEIKIFEAVFLNAGCLGKVDVLNKLCLKDFEEVMKVNVYANKELLDIFSSLKVKTIIATSSGASLNALMGWSTYCMSKTSLNMLIALYALEMKNTKLLALAPGVIDTAMRDKILGFDAEKFPSVKIIQEALAFSKEEAAQKMFNVFEKVNVYKSGSFLDVREI